MIFNLIFALNVKNNVKHAKIKIETVPVAMMGILIIQQIFNAKNARLIVKNVKMKIFAKVAKRIIY